MENIKITAPSPNRAYLAAAKAFAQICSASQTSDTLRMLYVIALKRRKMYAH